MVESLFFWASECQSVMAVLWGLGLDAGEERQVERAGDLDGLQGQRGRVEWESDRINHLRVHQQLGTHTAVSQASLSGKRREKMRWRQLICIQILYWGAT